MIKIELKKKKDNWHVNKQTHTGIHKSAVVDDDVFVESQKFWGVRLAEFPRRDKGWWEGSA